MSSHFGVSDLKTVNGDRDGGPAPSDPGPVTGAGGGEGCDVPECDGQRPELEKPYQASKVLCPAGAGSGTGGGVR